MSVDSILQKALDGGRLNAEEALGLFDCPDITLLGNVATRLYHKRTGREDGVVTYIVDRNINYTNVCVTDCTFCAFYRKEGDSEAYVLPFETIAAKIEEVMAAGGCQILMQGGHNASLKMDYYLDLFSRIKERFNIHLHALSPPEIVHLAKLSKLTVDETLQRLQEAGLDSIPGGGAEILSDRPRQIISPKKCNSSEWLEVMRTAHERGLPTTATMMFGHVETLAERIEHMIKLRDLQDQTGGFTAFICWPFQPGNTPLGKETGTTPATGWEYLKTLAIGRILLDNIDNHQSSWVTQGPKVGQMALFYGANDMGSTMFEENVVAAAGTTYHLDEQEIRRLIEDGGFIPQRRNMRYQFIA